VGEDAAVSSDDDDAVAHRHDEPVSTAVVCDIRSRELEGLSDRVPGNVVAEDAAVADAYRYRRTRTALLASIT